LFTKKNKRRNITTTNNDKNIMYTAKEKNEIDIGFSKGLKY